jgi:hypothetical protein
MNHTQPETTDTTRLAFQATIHCLTGCGIGEVLGLGGATLLGLGNAASIVLGIVLAFVFGYGLTLMDAGLADVLFWGSLALSLALAFVAAFPVNRWLIARGLGHAVMHDVHS